MRWIWVFLILLVGCESKELFPHWSDLSFDIRIEDKKSIMLNTRTEIVQWDGDVEPLYNYQQEFYEGKGAIFIEDGSQIRLKFGDYEPESIEVVCDFNAFDRVGPNDMIEEPMLFAKDKSVFNVEFEGHSVVYYDIRVMYDEDHVIRYSIPFAKLTEPYDAQAGQVAGDVIVKLREAINLESLTAFIEGDLDFVRVVSYTIEEDEVVYELNRVEDVITMSVDSSRNQLLSDEDRLMGEVIVKEIKQEASRWVVTLEDGSELKLFVLL